MYIEKNGKMNNSCLNVWECIVRNSSKTFNSCITPHQGLAKRWQLWFMLIRKKFILNNGKFIILFFKYLHWVTANVKAAYVPMHPSVTRANLPPHL